MPEICPLNSRPIKPYQKIWGVTKKVVQKAYLAVPGIITLPLHAMVQIQNHQPLLRNRDDNIFSNTYIWGSWVAYETARDAAIAKGISPAKATGAYLSTLIGGTLGAKALHLAQFHSDFLHSGGTWYGGALVGLATLYLYAKAAKVSFVKLLDSLAPSALIGQGIGRIGCWSAGCCPGEVLGLPTEPVSAVFDISMGLLLTRMSKSQSFEGKTSLFALASYALFRFAIEFCRHEPTVISNLTLSQLISVGILTGVGLLYSKLSSRTSPPQPQVETPVQTPKQKFWMRIADLLTISPFFFLTDYFTGGIIILINLVRATKEAGIWVYNRLRSPKTIS